MSRIGMALLFFILLFSGFGFSQERPRLVVGIVVDQMRWDYLYRYYDRYGQGGFKRILDEGYSYENCTINYCPAVTSAGHASIYTGTVPAFHGIIGNDWQDGVSGLPVNCTRDSSVKTIGSPSGYGQESPGKMLASTIGEELRLATAFRSKVFSVSLKDRGAILTCGSGCNAAFWFDDSTGRWVSSSAWMDDLPAWAEKFNQKGKADSLMSLEWNLLYPRESYKQSTDDNAPWERPMSWEEKPVFPHRYAGDKVKNYLPLCYSPFGSTYTFDFCRSLIENENLGARGQSDMLNISISSTDMAGHSFGPHSLEMEDMFIRLDKDLASFLHYLDKRLGNGNYLLFLSADHGSGEASEYLKSKKLASGYLNPRMLMKEVNEACGRRFGFAPIKSSYSWQFYFDNELMRSKGADKKEITGFILDEVKKNPAIQFVFSYDDPAPAWLPSGLREMFANGYLPGRSGDIQMVVKPRYSNYGNKGVDHAAWYPYDTRIPLLWYGWNIPNGSSFREVNITDIAPTISALLKIQEPDACTGKVLGELVR